VLWLILLAIAMNKQQNKKEIKMKKLKFTSLEDYQKKYPLSAGYKKDVERMTEEIIHDVDSSNKNLPHKLNESKINKILSILDLKDIAIFEDFNVDYSSHNKQKFIITEFAWKIKEKEK